MGVGAGVAWVLALVAAGAALAALIERRLARAPHAIGESGPSLRVSIRNDSRPSASDSWLYAAAPVIALIGVAWAAVVIPFRQDWVASDLQIGLFYFIVVLDFVVLAIAMAGWGSNAPGSIEACYRIVAQLVAYVIPLGLAILGPIMMARSLSTVDIVQAQQRSALPYILAQPLGFALYVVTALMQTYRNPFLEPFARSIEGGVLPQYGGVRALLFRVALSGLLFVVAAMGAVLFLGGYAGPWLPGPVWMALKTVAMLALLVWVGQRVPAQSVAAMLALSWKVLIPAGLVNVLAVGGLILFGVGQPGG